MRARTVKPNRHRWPEVEPPSSSIIEAIRAPARSTTTRSIAALTAVLLFSACTNNSSRVSSPVASGSRSNPPPTQRLKVAPAGFRLGAPVQREVAASTQNVVYVAGGLSSSGTSVAGVFSLDPASGNVASLGSVLQPFHDAAG